MECHCENEESSVEHGEEDKDEEDSYFETESDSHDDSKQRRAEDNDDDESHPYLQETCNNCERESESDSGSDAE